MKKLYYGNVNAILNLVSRSYNYNLGDVSYPDEGRSVSFILYDTEKGTLNGHNVINSITRRQFIDDLMTNYSLNNVTSYYYPTTDFKNYLNLIKFCEEMDNIAYAFNSISNSYLYQFSSLINGLTYHKGENFIFRHNLSLFTGYGYDSRSSISLFRDNKNIIGEKYYKIIAKNLLDECHYELNKFFETFKEDFDGQSNHDSWYNFNKNMIEYWYAYSIFAKENDIILDNEDIKKTFITIVDQVISAFKNCTSDKKKQKEFIKNLNYYYISYCYNYNNDSFLEFLINFNMYILNIKGVNKQTLKSFANDNYRIIKIIEEPENITYKNLVKDKINGVIKRNANTLNANVFSFAFDFFKDDIEWNQIDPVVLKKYFSEKQLEELKVQKPADTKYYGKIIESLDESKYPFIEFMSIILMINELKEEDFKNILPELSNTIHRFIHKNLTANDSYTNNYSYCKYFNMLKDKGGDYYNKNNVDLLFKALYINGSSLSTNMKTKLTIFCMQTGLDKATDSKELPTDYKSISMKLKMKK